MWAVLRALSLRHYRILADAWCCFLKWDFRVSYLNYQQWKPALLQPQSEHAQHSSVDFTLVSEVIRLSEKVARHHLRPMNCLRRCLCQQELLARRGIATQLQIGVKFDQGKLAAHSWLLCQGRIINDSEVVVGTYQPLQTAQTQQALQAMV